MECSAGGVAKRVTGEDTAAHADPPCRFEHSQVRLREAEAGERGAPRLGPERPRAKPQEALRRLCWGTRVIGEVGGRLDGSALWRRFKTAIELAGIPPLRFHDLRHTFGSLAINKASINQVRARMGHADIDTTMRYRDHKDRGDEAALLARPSPSTPPVAQAYRGWHE